MSELIIDKREAILVQLQAMLRTLRPGVTFSHPDGKHRPITTDLGGRVYSKVRAAAKADATEHPFVEILTSSGGPDTIREVADDSIYLGDLNIEVWGFVKADDQSDDFDAPVRARLNALRADLIIAVECFPYWTSDEFPIPINRRAGVMKPVLTSQFTEPATEAPDGFVKLGFAIGYAFSALNP